MEALVVLSSLLLHLVAIHTILVRVSMVLEEWTQQNLQ
jgi:hypothetical protein